MRCKVADQSQSIEPLTWRSSGPVMPSITFVEEPPSAEVLAHETARLHDELAEQEKRHQAMIAQVRREAFAEGQKQVREQVTADLSAAHNQIAQALATLAGTKSKLRSEAEGEMLKLALTIARRVLHREISLDPEALEGLVHTALQKLQNREISRVRVYAAGADAVRSALERIGAAPAVQVFPDPSLKNGDIIFETSFGEMDISIDSQLQEIQRGFADRFSIR